MGAAKMEIATLAAKTGTSSFDFGVRPGQD
jgi:hypothetical protein